MNEEDNKIIMKKFLNPLNTENVTWILLHCYFEKNNN